MSVRAETGGPVRVLFVIGTLDIGGTERQLVALATRLDRGRFAARVCCLEHEGPLAKDLREAGIPVDEIPFRGLSATRNPVAVMRRFRELVFLMRKVRPTIVQTFLPHANALGVLAARLARVPFVLIGLRGLDPAIPFWGSLAGRLAHLAVANAEAVGAHAVRSQGLPAAKVRVVRNGLDIQAFDQAAHHQALGLPPDPFVVTVANPNRFKASGLLVLVEAAAAVREQMPDVRFVLVGDGPERNRIAEAARGLGLVDRFLCVGSRGDVPAILARSVILALPSLAEGFPNVILEGMAAGKPVVATRTGGVPEAVVGGETGLLVPPGDPRALASAILAILRDPVRAKAMGSAGRDRVVREFGMDRAVRAMERLYDDLVYATPSESKAPRGQDGH
jgi:glycosyltransferase involved in cell wall biosynthesis